MKISRIAYPVVLAAAVATPSWGQIPKSSGRSGIVQAAPKILVANPFIRASSDSAASVAVGDGLRDRMNRVVGSDFHIIPREQMNKALELWGYPQDAILSQEVSTRFAKELNARAVMMSRMNREPDGRYSVTTRLAGLSDDAGYVINRVQAPGQTLEQFSKDVANSFKDPIKAYKDAKECINLSSAPDKHDKAVKAALKATKRVPDFGLAEFCLAEMAKSDGAPTDSVISHLKKAVQGDPLSLVAFTRLAEEYESQSDSSRVIDTFKQMLMVAPTNAKLRENAIKLFNQYGVPEAAVAVADEGIARDPFNPDFYDLKANAHAVAGQMPEALEALGQKYRVDSTGVDSTFFLKVAVFASAAEDTAQLVHWTQTGVRRYPDNVPLLEQLANAYVTAGELDSAIVATARLNELDSTTVSTALQTAKALSDNRRVVDALPFVDFAVEHGTDGDRLAGATILISGALPLLQEPRDLEGAAQASRRAIELAADDSPPVTRTANYILGLSTFLMVPQLDPQAEAQKSCELARQMDGLLTESTGALKAGKEMNPDQVDTFLGYVDQYRPRVASMLTAYCEG